MGITLDSYSGKFLVTRLTGAAEVSLCSLPRPPRSDFSAKRELKLARAFTNLKFYPEAVPVLGDQKVPVLGVAKLQRAIRQTFVNRFPSSLKHCSKTLVFQWHLKKHLNSTTVCLLKTRELPALLLEAIPIPKSFRPRIITFTF